LRPDVQAPSQPLISQKKYGVAGLGEGLAMLLITGTIRLPPGALARARPAMRAMIEASRAETGCLKYSYAEDVLDAGLMHITELWDTRAHLQAHFRSNHIAAWRAQWATLAISERNLKLYEVGEPEET
jgi:quinol monooxygenase YgiN